MLYSAYYNSPIGRLLLASDGKNLTGLWIEKQKYYADTVPDDIQEQADLPIFIKTREWLDKYFQGKNPAVSELAAGSPRRKISADGMENFMPNPARAGFELWRDCQNNCPANRQKEHVRPSRRRSCRA